MITGENIPVLGLSEKSIPNQNHFIFKMHTVHILNSMYPVLETVIMIANLRERHILFLSGLSSLRRFMSR